MERTSFCIRNFFLLLLHNPVTGLPFFRNFGALTVLASGLSGTAGNLIIKKIIIYGYGQYQGADRKHFPYY